MRVSRGGDARGADGRNAPHFRAEPDNIHGDARSAQLVRGAREQYSLSQKGKLRKAHNRRPGIPHPGAIGTRRFDVPTSSAHISWVGSSSSGCRYVKAAIVTVRGGRGKESRRRRQAPPPNNKGREGRNTAPAQSRHHEKQQEKRSPRDAEERRRRTPGTQPPEATRTQSGARRGADSARPRHPEQAPNRRQKPRKTDRIKFQQARGGAEITIK